MENLDQLCAEYGSKFAEQVTQKFDNDPKDAEALLTKALGVLQEQGLYAFALFCESRGAGEKEGAEKLEEISEELLRELQLIGEGSLLEEIQKEGGVATRIDDLILAIQLLEKSLIYARYHAKAMVKEKESSKGGVGE